MNNKDKSFYIPESFINSFKKRSRFERIRIRNHLKKASFLEVKVLIYSEEDRVIIGYSRYLRLYLTVPKTEFLSREIREQISQKEDSEQAILEGLCGIKCEVVLTGLDKETGTVWASRVKALEIKRERCFFNSRPQNNLYPGEKVRGQVLAVTSDFTVLEFGGIEKFLSEKDLFFPYKVGDTPEIKITQIDKDRVNKEILTLKYKIENLSQKDWYESVKDLKINEELKGIIIHNRKDGLILRIKNNLTLYTPIKKDQRSLEYRKGSQVLVTLKKIDYRGRRLFGQLVG